MVFLTGDSGQYCAHHGIPLCGDHEAVTIGVEISPQDYLMGWLDGLAPEEILRWDRLLLKIVWGLVGSEDCVHLSKKVTGHSGTFLQDALAGRDKIVQVYLYLVQLNHLQHWRVALPLKIILWRWNEIWWCPCGYVFLKGMQRCCVEALYWRVCEVYDHLCRHTKIWCAVYGSHWKG